MSDWRLKAYSVGIAAAEEKLGRNVTGDEYMAIHIAIEALVDAVVLVPSAQPIYREVSTAVRCDRCEYVGDEVHLCLPAEAPAET